MSDTQKYDPIYPKFAKMADFSAGRAGNQRTNSELWYSKKYQNFNR